MLKDDVKYDSGNAAPEFLTDEQLELVSGGLLAGPRWEIPGEPDPTQAPAIPGVHF
jgi:hypothetical protein